MLALGFLEELDCAVEGGRKLVMIDGDTRGEAFVFDGVGQGVVDIFIERFYYQAEVCKQLDRVLLGLEINLSEVEHERLECLRLETLLSELLLMCLDYLFNLIVFITFCPLDMVHITKLDVYWLHY